MCHALDSAGHLAAGLKSRAGAAYVPLKTTKTA
jgi:hypothetical protein